jgi:hypothetical protein
MTDELEKDIIDSRKEVIDFLKDIQMYYGTYHNHKETVGWAGVALFAGLMLGAATVIREWVTQAGISCCTRAGISLAVMSACFVCWLYVHKQFALRKRAADLVAACCQVRSQIISDPSKILNPAEWAPPIQTGRGGMQSTHVLPKAIKAAADQISFVGQTSRIVLETCAYAILFGACAALLAIIWTC